MFIKQIDYKSSKESIQHIQQLGKWASKGAPNEDGGGTCLLTFSGGVICKRQKIFLLDSGAEMRRY